MKHVIIETGLGKGVAEYGNMGDISMLQVAVHRVHKLFPKACIQVLTDSAENLTRYCPTATPLDNRGRALWFANGVLLGRYSNLAPSWFLDLLVWLKRMVRSRFPNLLRAILIRRLNRHGRPHEAEAVVAFLHALRNADLLLICGAGGFYDGCQPWNMEILDVLEAAIQKKIPTVMLGQGFGPISDAKVISRAMNIFPQVDFITLRGGRGSSAILKSLGVAESRIEITGDEALELACESGSQQHGRGLGINLRFAGSASTDEDDVGKIRPVLQSFARKLDVPIIPLPIAIHKYTRDDLTIKKLLIGFDDKSDGGNGLDSPLKVIQKVACCRIVVTGAYHAAVFALAQGIPVIGLAKSSYFAGKLLGLKDQFGEGCEVVLLDEPDLDKRLHRAIEEAWENADSLRAPLQVRARTQVEASRRSYERLKELTSHADMALGHAVL